MKIVAPARVAYRRIRKLAKRAYSYLLLGRLSVRNRLSREPVTGEAPAIVSLTTYGSRLATVGYTIESIAAGTVRPRRLILWLDEPCALRNLPPALRRLMARGLEVKLTKNYGPHTKYYPALPIALQAGFDLVTADDDIIYGRTWLQGLVRAASKEPAYVHCYRANSITCASDQSLEPYEAWPRCTTTAPSHRNFATGVSGVLYPRSVMTELVKRGDGFLRVTPKADDVWLHWVALRAGVQVRQLSTKPRHFPLVPGTQRSRLMDENVSGGGNDIQIERIYTASDIATIRRSPRG